MKRAYLAYGTLVSPAMPQDSVLRVDIAVYTYLSTILGSDYCYLVLGGTEIVKILGFSTPNVLLVQRGVDHTEIVKHNVGANLRYGITPSEIHDATTFVGYGYTLSGRLFAGNTGAINYGPMTMQGLGGVEVKGEIPRFAIYDIPDNAGCRAGTLPPDIPIRLQPYRVVDSGDVRVTDDGTYRKYA